MEKNKKIAVVLIGVIILAIAVYMGIKQVFPDRTDQNLTESITQEEDTTKEVAPATSDAMTGTVTAMDESSITVKGEEGEKKFSLRETTDAYSIDNETGLVVRDFSEISVGSKITVDYNMNDSTVIYLVIEQ